MLSWAILWDVVKVSVIPMLGLIWAIIKQKISKLDHKIEKLEEQNNLLDKKLIKMEATFVTHDQLRELFGELMTNMEKGTDSLERRIDKTMDLKIDPLKDLLTKFVDKR